MTGHLIADEEFEAPAIWLLVPRTPGSGNGFTRFPLLLLLRRLKTSAAHLTQLWHRQGEHPGWHNLQQRPVTDALWREHQLLYIPLVVQICRQPFRAIDH